jgi:Protein of unknown function (DUF1501)
MTLRASSDCERFYRRDFLTVGAASMLGLSLADVLRHETRAAGSPRRRAQGVILIWLGGGPATIDMWDLKPDAPDVIRGEFRPIPTRVAGIEICEHLPRVAGVMDRCTLVRSLHHSIPAHGPGTILMATGHAPAAALEYPSLGALAAHLLPPRPGVPSYVLFDNARAGGFTGTAGFLGIAYNPFEVPAAPRRGVRAHLDGIALPDGFTMSQLEVRRGLQNRLGTHLAALDDMPASLDRFQQQAIDILRSDRTARAFNLDQEPRPVREAYGQTPFAQSVLTARRLIEAGTRFVTVGLGGWDTHGNNFGTLRTRLLPELDRALAALVADLHTRGLLQSTIVYCVGEFGRTPRVNGGAGRDHWARAMAAFLAGGPFQGGRVHGSTDRLGFDPGTSPCSPADLSATIFQALGIRPSHEVLTTSGRRIMVFREARVLEEMVQT